jgi:hypothetical protein
VPGVLVTVQVPWVGPESVVGDVVMLSPFWLKTDTLKHKITPCPTLGYT